MINLYTNSTIGSYTTGTVTCTNNSDVVTGTGTTWSEIVNPGDILTLNDDKLYVIKTVNSNTSITLDKVFAESTVSNSAYRIFLNTAAHFPSDTAAKVERALEQLSDINEAAINNDRTVTAATKVNGKGLTSTTGNIDLNPPTVNSNTGGQINFHYNQSANATSSIVENASGQIRVNGDLYLNGNLNLRGDVRNSLKVVTTNSTAGSEVLISNPSIIKGTAPSTTQYANIGFYGSEMSTYEDRIGLFECQYNTDNSTHTRMMAINSTSAKTTNSCSISCNVDSSGNVYTYAPTPDTNDSSTKIATTAFVNNRLPYTTGTWTPVVAGGTTAGDFTYSDQNGFYVKIGRLVLIYARIVTTNYTTHPEGRFIINGLPFPSRNSTYNEMVAFGYSGGVNQCMKRMRIAFVPPNTSRVEIAIVNTANPEEIMYGNFSTSSATGLNLQFSSSDKTMNIYVSGCYESAS